MRRFDLALAFVWFALAGPTLAATPAPDPDLTLAARETIDGWHNLTGGVGVGYTTLNKLQVSGIWTANPLSDPEFRAHF